MSLTKSFSQNISDLMLKILQSQLTELVVILNTLQGWIQGFWKGVALYDCHHGWPEKKILGFRWSKKAKIMLETISFWQNISLSIFKFSPFLYTMKACQWNLINFSKFPNALIRKEKNHLCSSQWEKKIWEKLDFVSLQVIL